MVDLPIRIENIVAVAMLGIDIPLEKLVVETGNSDYEPEPFSGIVVRSGEKGVASLIFSSGKIVCTGTKSLDHAKEVIAKAVVKVKDVGINVPKDYPVEIENMVASSRLGAEFSLSDVAFSLDSAEYDPVKFPGLIFTASDPSVTMMLFPDGKILCTGAHSEDEVKKALNQLVDGLRKAGVKA